PDEFATHVPAKCRCTLVWPSGLKPPLPAYRSAGGGTLGKSVRDAALWAKEHVAIRELRTLFTGSAM
ncbi:MAG TPA: hypothetical protein VJ323_02060, partial [Bryobacteraceae bacterium]|nr:hypothetical protein [Bryobacteraceae bacterium]